MILAVLLGAASGWLPADPAMAVMGVFVFVWALYTPLAGAATALICAALFGDGFVLDRLGVLSWHGVGDAEILAGLVFAALLGAAIRQLYLYSRRDVEEPRPGTPVGPPPASRSRVTVLASRPHRSTLR